MGATRTGTTVGDYTSTRQPHTHFSCCPACDSGGPFPAEVRLEYRSESPLRVGEDEFKVTQFGSVVSDPHLKVTCKTCGFWWEMDVANP